MTGQTSFHELGRLLPLCLTSRWLARTRSGPTPAPPPPGASSFSTGRRWWAPGRPAIWAGVRPAGASQMELAVEGE